MRNRREILTGLAAVIATPAIPALATLPSYSSVLADFEAYKSLPSNYQKLLAELEGKGPSWLRANLANTFGAGMSFDLSAKPATVYSFDSGVRETNIMDPQAFKAFDDIFTRHVPDIGKHEGDYEIYAGFYTRPPLTTTCSVLHFSSWKEKAVFIICFDFNHSTQEIFYQGYINGVTIEQLWEQQPGRQALKKRPPLTESEQMYFRQLRLIA